MTSGSYMRPSRDGLFLWFVSHGPILGHDPDPRIPGLA